ncbi:hypothetical protein MMC13_002692 [Lambiella insularis]|nr:hypothetical protein [Lambiella insularis]
MHLPHLADKRVNEPRTRQWIIPVPKSKRNSGWLLAKTLTTYLVILLLAGVMIWRNVAAGQQTVVTWRCEYAWLLICWPMACLVWLILAVALLHALAEKIEIGFSEDAPTIRRSRLELLLLPYRVPRPITNSSTAMSLASPAASRYEAVVSHAKSMFSPTTSSPDTLSPHSFREVAEPHFSLVIKMRGANSWDWFESAVEAMAVGIYMYATFVLTSSLFLSGRQAIIYATVMTLSLSAIRILVSL